MGAVFTLVDGAAADEAACRDGSGTKGSEAGFAQAVNAAGSLSDVDATSDSTGGGASTVRGGAGRPAKALERAATTGHSTVSTVADACLSSDTASDAATAAGTAAGALAGLGASLVEARPGLRVVPLVSQHVADSRSGGGAVDSAAPPAAGVGYSSDAAAVGTAGAGGQAAAAEAVAMGAQAPAAEEQAPTAANHREDTALGPGAAHHMPVVPPLHKAAAEGDVAAVLRLLTQGVDPNEEDTLLGETPLFEAAAVDAAAAVALLLLFGADAKRRGRHTTAVASEFAPAGGATAELLGAWEQGNRGALADVLVPALRSITGEGSAEAVRMARRLEAERAGRRGAEASAGDGFAAAAAVGGLGSLPMANGEGSAAEPLQAEDPVPPGVASEAIEVPFHDEAVDERLERVLPRPAPVLETVLASLHSRMASQAPVLHGARLLSPDSAAARALWAMVAAYEPRAALSVLPSTSRSMAELMLGDSDDAAWRHATGCIDHDVAMQDRRRRGVDGRPLSWRSTFQELVTQRVYCWGTDGIITGFGARAPVKVYSRPRAVQLDPQAVGAVLSRPYVRAIACGRRHSAAVTFGGSVYVWGRDVVPVLPPPEEALAGLEAWHAWRVTQGRSTTSSDRPRRLLLGRAQPTSPSNRPDSRAGLPHDAGDPEPMEVVGLSATSSATLLRLRGGQTVCTGGWTAQEAQLPERITEAMEARRRAPRLPALRKITRGFCFNVALSRDGRVFIWRHSGLVPTGIIDTVPLEPTSILPGGDLAADIAVGEGHVLVLTEAGRVWSFGWRQLSALGRGARLTTAAAIVPSPISGLERVVQIAAGATYSLCVDVEGSLWLFGEGPCITGCFNNPTAVNEPRRVPACVFGGRCVLAAACGDGHVLALTAWDPCRRLLQPGAWFADGDACNHAEVDGVQDAVVGEWTP